MARLTDADPVPAQAQLLAIAWVRWRIFVNGLRRRSRNDRHVPGLVLAVLLRILALPFLAIFFVGPVAASGFLAWFAVSHGYTARMPLFFAGIFLVWQFSSLNGISISATSSGFEPLALIRFPIPFRRYLSIRLLIGLLTPSTAVGSMSLLAAAIGIGIARPGLLPAALLSLGLYAALNVFFTRMVGAWLDRWLATRRAREIFGALLIAFILGVNFFTTRGSMYGRRHGGRSYSPIILILLRASEPFLRWLPPGLTAGAIFSTHVFGELVNFAGLLAWTVLFLAIFAARLRRQFLGEFLSEGPARATVRDRPAARGAFSPAVGIPAVGAPAAAAPISTSRGLLSPVLAACIRKEWLYLRSNTKQLMGLLASILFVLILTSPNGVLGRHPAFLLSGAGAYVLFAPVTTLFNVFGADGPGVQLYLLAPVRMRDVLLAKNLACLILLFVQVALAWCVVFLRFGQSMPFATELSAGLWTVFVIFLCLTVGSLRSIQSPRHLVPGQSRRGGIPVSGTNTLLILGLLFGSVLLQVVVGEFSRRAGNPWLASAFFAACAALALLAYALLLHHADRLILDRRALLTEELCKIG